jgi:hypothetical protein
MLIYVDSQKIGAGLVGPAWENFRAKFRASPPGRSGPRFQRGPMASNPPGFPVSQNGSFSKPGGCKPAWLLGFPGFPVFPVSKWRVAGKGAGLMPFLP